MPSISVMNDTPKPAAIDRISPGQLSISQNRSVYPYLASSPFLALPAVKTRPVESKARVCHVPEAKVVMLVRLGTRVGLRTACSLDARPNCPRLLEPHAYTVPLFMTAKDELPN